MLYQRWRQIADRYASDLALLDTITGCRWTFGQLAALSEKPLSQDGPIVFPKGTTADFVFSVLRGWRLGRVICPLESTQSPPLLTGLPSECRHVKVTSATSGPARFVTFTDDQLMADAANIVATMGLRPEWPNAAVISLAHSYGFSNLVLPLLLHGIPLILAGAPLPEQIRRIGRIAPAVCVPAVPAMWRAWADANAIGSHIRLAISAGAPLPLPLESDVLHRFGLKIHNFYGASECGGIGYDRAETIRTDPQCVGAPLENVTVRVTEGGCLEVSSAAVALSYLPGEDPFLGRYRTSDVAELRGGLIFLRGRASDTINVAGRKVSPDVIESALREHPSVRECVVFGVDDNEAARGERIVACVALRRAEAADGLRQFLLSKIDDWQLPRDWWFVDELAANERGKLSRSEWRRRYLER